LGEREDEGERVMNGYQPKKMCQNCVSFNNCLKGKIGKNACKKYVGVQPIPPNSGSCVTPEFRKPTPPPAPNPTKQRTVLSVRDFAILYNIVSNKIMQMESQAQTIYWSKRNDSERIEKERAENMERLHQDPYYQDLLRIREKLGELNIEIETPSVEVE
jgi:hypothetical protein